MDNDYEVVIERHEDGSVKRSVIHDVEAFKRSLAQNRPSYATSAHPTRIEDVEPPLVPTTAEGEPTQATPYRETYEMKRQQVIAACPFRSYKKYEMVNGQLKVEHLFRDGTPAEGCGCSTMKCLLGKGNKGDVTIDDCTNCVTEAGLLGKELPVQPPSVYQKIKNFGKAAAVHIIKGMPTASPEQQEARLVICRECPYDNNGTCGVCGCDLKLKTKWAEQACPLSPPKWGPVKPEEGEVESKV